jgi:hypothetical protein
MWSFEERLLLFEDGVTLTLTDGRRDSAWLPFPPSKYSIKSEVCDLFELRPWPCPSFSDRLRRVAIVTGLPSSGMVYWDFSVSLESSSVPTLPCVSVFESVSVGAGRGGRLRESTPIMRVEDQAWSRRDAWVVIFVCPGRNSSLEEAGDLPVLEPEWPTE